MNDIMLSHLEDFSRGNLSSNSIVSPDEKISTTDTDIDSIAIDIQIERDKAYQQGYADSAREQEDRWKSHIESLQTVHCNEIADNRKKFESCTSDFISAAIKDSIKLLSDSFEHELIRILAPFLEVEISRNAARALAACIVDVFKKGECGTIKIHGPKNLHAFIEQYLGEYSPMVLCEDSNQIDFSTEISGGIVSTRLESWLSDVKKLLEVK
ncbi:MAG: hypothetical protein EU981_00155 [Candidatus Liberibacter ctenarytainae]|uniref:Uncharacterized protein n=1 Tax=Candidatus Liberibacter ctenarytainae TaxID=2020335 RepID=A0A937AR33_9HYPH|nr:hypothetical protein [Candidatus Liberibacter ctenarytainae]